MSTTNSRLLRTTLTATRATGLRLLLTTLAIGTVVVACSKHSATAGDGGELTESEALAQNETLCSDLCGEIGSCGGAMATGSESGTRTECSSACVDTSKEFAASNEASRWNTYLRCCLDKVNADSDPCEGLMACEGECTYPEPSEPGGTTSGSTSGTTSGSTSGTTAGSTAGGDSGTSPGAVVTITSTTPTAAIPTVQKCGGTGQPEYGDTGEKAVENTPLSEGGTSVTSMTIKYMFDVYFGEPTDRANMKWEGSGSVSSVGWIGEVTDPTGKQYTTAGGKRVYAFSDVGGTKGPGAGYSINSTGSPSWSQTFRTYDNATGLAYGVTTAEAQAIYKACFTVEHIKVFTLSGEPAHTGN